MLERLSTSDHRPFCSYHPEKFPGLIYHILHPKLCMLIFSSGKIVLTGAKNKKDIDYSFWRIQPTLRSFRKDDLVGEEVGVGNLTAARNIL